MPGKRYYLYLLLLLLSIPSYSNAQWEQVLDEETRFILATDSVIYAGIYPWGLYNSMNNGQNWTLIHGAAGITDIIVDNNVMFMSWGNKLTRSTNGGYSWTNLLITDFIYDIDLKNSTLIAGANTFGVYVSSNYGETWVHSSLQDRSVRSLVRKGNKIFAATEESGIFLSTNEGLNWTQTSFMEEDLMELAVHGSTMFVSVRYKGLYTSSNEGLSWQQTSIDTGNVQTIISYGNSVLITLASPDKNGVYRSDDNFNTWTSVNEGLPFESTYTLDFNSEYFFTGTVNAIYRRPLDQITGTAPINTEIPDKHSLHQNYPNPFNPSTKISFAVSKKGHVKMLIYDYIGREVAALINEELSPGTYEKEFDGSNLSSGIYYYKLIIGEFSETKKMVLVK